MLRVLCMLLVLRVLQTCVLSLRPGAASLSLTRAAHAGLAMIGIAGMVAQELATGKALF